MEYFRYLFLLNFVAVCGGKKTNRHSVSLGKIYLYFMDWRFKSLLEYYFAAKFSQNG